MILAEEPNLESSSLCQRTSARPLPLVSVIIPTYNRAGYLPATLDSLRAQTVQDFEVIVIDDGSCDGTRELIAGRPEPVRYFYQENAGPAAARNRGLERARGEFVAFLDSDDLWRPRFIEAMTGYLRTHPEVGIAFCRFQTIADDGRILPRRRKRPYAGLITAALFGSTFITTPSVLARRDILLKVGGFDTGLTTSEDYNLWLRLSLTERFGHVEEVLCLRRSHPGTQSRNGSPEPLIRKAEMLERFYREYGDGGRIPPAVACPRLGKVFRSAGRACLRASDYLRAGQLYRRSLAYQPLSLRSWLGCLWSDLRARQAVRIPRPVG